MPGESDIAIRRACSGYHIFVTCVHALLGADRDPLAAVCMPDAHQLDQAATHPPPPHCAAAPQSRMSYTHLNGYVQSARPPRELEASSGAHVMRGPWLDGGGACSVK
jgi:hypothetical protein